MYPLNKVQDNHLHVNVFSLSLPAFLPGPHSWLMQIHRLLGSHLHSWQLARELIAQQQIWVFLWRRVAPPDKALRWASASFFLLIWPFRKRMPNMQCRTVGTLWCHKGGRHDITNTSCWYQQPGSGVCRPFWESLVFVLLQSLLKVKQCFLQIFGVLFFGWLSGATTEKLWDLQRLSSDIWSFLPKFLWIYVSLPRLRTSGSETQERITSLACRLAHSK